MRPHWLAEFKRKSVTFPYQPKEGSRAETAALSSRFIALYPRFALAVARFLCFPKIWVAAVALTMKSGCETG
jgi:hypothetical protein